MAFKNPVFGRIDDEQKQGRFATFRTGPSASAQPVTVDDLERQYAGPPATAADTGRVTYDDVIMKTAAQFVLLLAGAAVSWRYVSSLSVEHQSRGIAIWLAAMFVGLGIGLAISFRRTISVPLILTYAVVEGVFVGAASEYFNTAYPGVVGQAVIGTLAAFAGMLIAYKSGLIKVNDKFRRIMFFAIAGYACVALVSLVSAFLGVGGGFGFYGVGRVRRPALRRRGRLRRGVAGAELRHDRPDGDCRRAGQDGLAARPRAAGHARLALHRAAAPAGRPAQQLISRPLVMPDSSPPAPADRGAVA